MLLPLDPDEDIVEPKPRVTRAQAFAVAAAIGSLTILAAYSYWDSASSLKPTGGTPLTNPGETTQSGKGPHIVEEPQESGRVTFPPAPPKKELTPPESHRAQETNAHLEALIEQGDYAKAINYSIEFRKANPELAMSHGHEYRRMLMLQRIAAERFFSPLNPSRPPTPYDTGDLHVAIVDHQLMTACLKAAMPTLALEHFKNAEQGYDRALFAARQREHSASDRSSAKRDIQRITESLGLLYTSWAEHEPDVTMLQRADAAFRDSELLLAYAKDPSSAKRRILDGKAIVELTRQRLR